MSKRLFVFPYKIASHSATVLARALGTLKIRANGRYVLYPNHRIINWGYAGLPQWWRAQAVEQVLNLPQYVNNASDKTQTFKLLSQTQGIYVPDWTCDRNVATNWLAVPRFGGKLNAVVCRTLTRANSGRGIVLAKTVDEIVNAPLYTRYTPKTEEYRVHVFRRFGVIDIQQKRKKTGFATDESCNPYIRNHPNGWIFCREGVVCPPIVCDIAMSAIGAMKLDFGAVDIGYHPDFGSVIYEINTAPGLEGHTVESYTSTFRKFQL